MKLSREEVLQIASLARLELTEEEIENYGSQLSDILAHFESLQNVDTSTATETSSTLKEQLPFREDHPASFPRHPKHPQQRQRDHRQPIRRPCYL